MFKVTNMADRSAKESAVNRLTLKIGALEEGKHACTSASLSLLAGQATTRKLE